MNYLIDKIGNTFNCSGVEHSIYCKSMLNTSLKKFLSSGIRVKIHLDEIVIESIGGINEVQKRIINKILRNNIIYSLVIDISGKYNRITRLRPIKSIGGMIC